MDVNGGKDEFMSEHELWACGFSYADSVKCIEDGHDADNSKQSPADMTAFVQNLLVQMQTRFQTMSESIIGKIDEMGNRIDELEQSINELRAEMGQEGSTSPSASLKTREENKPSEEN